MKPLFVIALFIPLLSSLAVASQVKVLYFYSSACPLSQQLEPLKEEVKEFWEGKVEWVEYDFIKDREPFERYTVFNFPVAIISCFNRSYKVERDEISTKLNATIAECFMCNGIIFLDKECEPGIKETKACGKCGISYRSCESCKWSSWSMCTDEKECYPSSIEKRPCNIGNCAGYQTRKCNLDCYWSEWSFCELINPECTPTIVVIPKSTEQELKPSKGMLSLLLIFSLLIFSIYTLRKLIVF